MKKLLAIILTAAMATAIFAAAAPLGCYGAAAYSVDWYKIDGELISAQGSVDQLVTYNKPVYVKDADAPDKDKVLFFGWVQLEGNKEISAAGYKTDEDEAVYDDNFFTRLTNIPGCRIDRTAELNKAGFQNAEGFVIEFGYAGLSDGDHTVSLMVKGDDGVECAFFTYGFTVAAAGTPEPAVIINTRIDSQTSADEISETKIVEISGWTGANYEITDIGYSIDNGEPVFGDGSVILIPVAEDDPVRSAGTGGGRYAERFSAHIDLEALELSDGVHTLAIHIKVADEYKTVLRIYKGGDGKEQGAAVFTCADPDDHENDVWFCEKARSYTVGWWMQPENMPDLEEYDICISFSTASAFDGFMMACFSGLGADAAELRISLLDEDGGVLEDQQIKVTGDRNTKARGFISVLFDKAYAKGAYTIRIELIGGRYFVLASGDFNGTEDNVSVYGNNAAQQQDDEHGYLNARAPAVKLNGAQDPQTGEGPEGSSGEDETEYIPEAAAKDVNGDGEANNKDVVYLFRLVSGAKEYDEACDIDGDGENNNKDVVALFRALSKLETQEEETVGEEEESEEIIYTDESDEITTPYSINSIF